MEYFRACSGDDPGDVLTGAGMVTVVFTSDVSITRPGFHAQYKLIQGEREILITTKGAIFLKMFLADIHTTAGNMNAL